MPGGSLLLIAYQCFSHELQICLLMVFQKNDSVPCLCIGYKTLGSFLHVTSIKLGGRGKRVGGNCIHVIIRSPPTQKRGRTKNICAPVLSPFVCLTRSWLSPFSAWGREPHGNVTDTLWYLHQSTSWQISGIFALCFHGLSLVLLLSTKQDSLTWSISLDISAALLSGPAIGAYTSTVI